MFRFVFANIILTSVYFSKVLSDNEDIDYQSEVFMEGFNVAVPLFLLTWIMTYTGNKLFKEGELFVL